MTIHQAGNDPHQDSRAEAKSAPGSPVVAMPVNTRLRKPATVAGMTAGAARALAATDHSPMRGSIATSTGVHAIWATKGTMSAVTSTVGASGRCTARRRRRIGTTNMIAAVETTDRTNPTEVASTGTNARSRLAVEHMTATGEIPPPRRNTIAAAIAIPAARMALGSNPTMKT